MFDRWMLARKQLHDIIPYMKYGFTFKIFLCIWKNFIM